MPPARAASSERTRITASMCGNARERLGQDAVEHGLAIVLLRIALTLVGESLGRTATIVLRDS
jgi:hypothetical protein